MCQVVVAFAEEDTALTSRKFSPYVNALILKAVLQHRRQNHLQAKCRSGNSIAAIQLRVRNILLRSLFQLYHFWDEAGALPETQPPARSCSGDLGGMDVSSGFYSVK